MANVRKLAGLARETDDNPTIAMRLALDTLSDVGKRRFLGTFVVVAASSMLACGDSKPDASIPPPSATHAATITNSTHLTHGALVSKLNRYCRKYSAQVGTLPLEAKQAAENNDYETTADLYDRRVAIGSRSMSALRNLGTPPARDTAAFTFLLTTAQTQEDAIAKIPEALRNHDLDAVEAELTIISNASVDQSAAAKTLGADECTA